MGIYIILLVIMLLLIKSRNSMCYINLKSLIILVITIILFCLCVFKSTHVGSDYHNYYIMFLNQTYQFMVQTSTESGYAHLTVFARSLNNFFIIPSVVFIIGYIGVHMVGKQCNVNRFTLLAFFVLTGFYFQQYTALRQMIAVGIVYVGIYCLLKFDNQIIFSFILFIIALFIAKDFHRTAMFMIILLILPFIKYGKKTVAISGIMTVLLFITGISTRILNDLVIVVPHYGIKYQNGNLDNHNSFLLILIESIPMIVQFVFLYFFVSNNKIKSQKGRFILAGYLLYLIMFMGFNQNLVRRLQIYTFIFPMLYSCLFMGGLSWKNNKFLRYKISHSDKILYIIFWIMLYIGKLLTNRFDIVPYSFF